MPTPYLAPTLQDQGYTGATGTTPYKPATTQQVDTLQSLYNNSPVANAPQVVSATATVININFDGTKNNGEFPAPGETSTNVFELARLQREAGNPNNTIYLPGVGAQTVPVGTLDANGNPAPGSSPSNWDSIPFNAGDVANSIVKDAYTQLTDRVGAILSENPNAEISLNLSGFSRGGAEATAFANYVNEHGIPGYCNPGDCQIDSMVLFDPVDQTNGRLNTAPPTNVKSTLVMVAENEGRAIMPAMPVGGNAEVVLVPGAHADVGGSFNPDGVSAVTRKMARDFQEKSGVPVAEIPDSLAPNWEQMNVHNSGLDNYGNTVWSFNENYRSYEGAGFGSPSVADVIRNGVPYVPSADNPASGDALDYKVPADPSQPDGVQLTVREVTDRHGNSTLTVMDADGHVVMTALPGDVLVREPSTGRFTLTDGVDGQISTYTPEVAVISDVPVTPDYLNPSAVSTNTLNNYLDTQGNALSSAQQTTLATQIDQLGLGGEGDLSFYSLPSGGALIANADGDIVGEIRLSKSGDLNIKATAIDANGNNVEVNQHINPQGDNLNQAQYNAQTQQQANASVNLFNSLMAAQQWDQLDDIGKLTVLVNVYSAVDTFGGDLPGDLGGLASVLSLMQGLESGNDMLVLSSSLQLGQLGLDAYSDYMTDLALQMADDLMASATVDAASSAAMDAAAEAALESAAASNAAGQAVPYVSYVMALQNFEDHPEQSAGTMAGTYVGQALGAEFGPVGVAIGGAIGGMIGGMVGGMFGDDDIPMREGLAHAQWDASGHTQVLTSQDAEGGGATANSWMSSLVGGLQAGLDQHTDAEGQPQYGLVPNLLPSVGFKYDPDGFNLGNGAQGFVYLQWTDETGQAQTRYYDGAGNRGDGSGETLSGDFVQHAQAAIAPAWQVQTVLAHYQQSGEIDLPTQTQSLPTELADGLHQTLQVVTLELGGALPAETASNNKWMDVDADGYAEQTQWVNANQAMLAVDLNGDGQIGLGETLNLQAAGQVQHARTSMGWLDANDDGKLTAQDPAFAALKLWVDVNSDGKGANTELQGVSQAGITAIDFSTHPPSIERSDGSTQALTVQTLTADTMGVAFEPTAGGVVETTEQLEGTGSSVLHAVNTREFDGQAAHAQGGTQDVDGSGGEVVQVDASKLATTTHNTIANSSKQTSITVGAGDSRLKSSPITVAAGATTSANRTSQAGAAFVPAGQNSSVQSEMQAVTESMIESAQSMLLGPGGGAGLGVLAAVAAGATQSAQAAEQRVQLLSVASKVSALDQNAVLDATTGAVTEAVSLVNTFATLSNTSSDANSNANTGVQPLGFRQAGTDPSAQSQAVFSKPSTTADTPTLNAYQVQARVTGNSLNQTAASYASSTSEETPTVSSSAASASALAAAPSLGYPEVRAETLQGTEDVVLRLNQALLLANDSTPNASADPSQPALTISAVSAPVNGQVSLVNGEVLFAPDANFHGTASFTYTVTDQYGLSTTGTATLEIATVNDAPVTQGESYASDEDIGLIFTQAQLLANDSDVDVATDGQVLSISRVGQAEHGTVWLDADGNLRFVPDANYHGPAKFTYWVSDGAAADGAGAETPATMRLTIAAVNDIPVAQGETTDTAEDTTLLIDAARLLANDTDVDVGTDQQVLNISAVSNALHCTVSLETKADGTQQITFVPDINFHGKVTFDYTVSDGNGGTALATAVVNLSAVNDAPVTLGETATSDEDIPLLFTSADLLANDSDVDTVTDNQILSISRVGDATHGTVTLDAQGQVHFLPEANYHGPAQFTYWVSDGSAADGAGAEVPATVNLTILAVNDLPVVVGEIVTTNEDTPLLFDPALLLANDSDVDTATDGQVLSITAVGSATHGAVAFVTQTDGSQRIAFTPELNFFGVASYQYTVSDGAGGSTVGTVVVNLAAVNDAPDVVNETINASEDTLLTLTQTGLLSNDSDVDNSQSNLRIVGVSNATHGSVTLNANGSISFTPELDYFGVATFNYTVGDGAGGFSVGTATVNIAPVNDAPVAVGESLTLNEDEIATLSVASLLTNDTDVDNTHAQLSIQSVGNATHGNVSLVTTNGNTSVVFTPELNFNGTASFTYTVSDGVGGNATTSMSLNFTPVNDVPVVNSELFMGKRNVSYSMSAASLLANDTDVETPSGLTIASVGNAKHGAVSLVNGNVVFVPEAGYAGRGSFDYVVQDANGGQSSATTQIDFSRVNVNPTAVDDSFSGFEDVPFNITQAQLLVNDSDSDNANSNLRVVNLGSATHGTAAFDVHGNVVFTPDVNFNGHASFAYQVSDGDGGSTWATASLSIASVNDAPIIEDVWYGRPVYGYQAIEVPFYDENGSSSYTRYDVITSLAFATSLVRSGAQLFKTAVVQLPDGEGGTYSVTNYQPHTPTYYLNGDMKPISFDYKDATQIFNGGDNGDSYILADDLFRQNGGVVAFDPDGNSQAITFSVSSAPQHGHAWANQYVRSDAPEALDHTQLSSYWASQNGAWQYLSMRGDTYSGNDAFQISATDTGGASTHITVNTAHKGSNPSGGGGKKPVTLDLNGDGIQYIGLDDSKVYFDINDDSWRERMAWVGGGDGLLALDLQGDQTIDKWNEISFVSYQESAQTDLEGLLAFDSSGNGKLDRLDARWHEFGAWVDANANGVCEAGEFRTLDDLEIVSIDLHSDHQVSMPANGVTEFGQSSFTMADGKIYSLGDVAFEVDLTQVLPQMTESDIQLANVIRQAFLFNQMANTANVSTEPPLSYVSNEQLTQDWAQSELHALVDVQTSNGARQL
jgi:predicted RNA-binding protein with TRAM domain